MSPDVVLGHPERPQSWNRYSYSYGNPILYIDRNGLQPEDSLNPRYEACGEDRNCQLLAEIGSGVRPVAAIEAGAKAATQFTFDKMLKMSGFSPATRLVAGAIQAIPTARWLGGLAVGRFHELINSQFRRGARTSSLQFELFGQSYQRSIVTSCDSSGCTTTEKWYPDEGSRPSLFNGPLDSAEFEARFSLWDLGSYRRLLTPSVTPMNGQDFCGAENFSCVPE